MENNNTWSRSMFANHAIKRMETIMREELTDKQLLDLLRTYDPEYRDPWLAESEEAKKNG